MRSPDAPTMLQILHYLFISRLTLGHSHWNAEKLKAQLSQKSPGFLGIVLAVDVVVAFFVVPVSVSAKIKFRFNSLQPGARDRGESPSPSFVRIL